MTKSYFCLLSAILLHTLPEGGIADGVDKQRIVGGEEAEKGRYPYQVALVSDWYAGSGVHCGGSLVDKDWVLSAAHCKGALDRAIIGRHNFTDDNEMFEDIEIDYEVQHPDYLGGIDNDYLMVKLKKSSKYSTVLLDDGSADLSSGVDVNIMGWGHHEWQGSKSNVLMEIESDVVNNTDCYNDYGGKITGNMLCAARAGKDACTYDSGGPLIIKGANASTDVLAGIVSWGKECAYPDHPGVYARVSPKIDWINEIIASDNNTDTGDDGSEDGDSSFIDKLLNMIFC